MRSGAVRLNLIMYFVMFLVGTWWVNPGWLGAHTPGWTLAGRTSRERSLAGGDLSDVVNIVGLRTTAAARTCRALASSVEGAR